MLPPTDREGYLRNLADWTPTVAEHIARGCSLKLTNEHWEIIHLMRAYHDAHDLSPTMRPLVKLVRTRLGDDKGSSLHLLKLFPGNPAKLAAKIAGLPPPTLCI